LSDYRQRHGASNMTDELLDRGAGFDIPQDRPAIGADVSAFKAAFGLTVHEAQSILGILPSQWYEVTKHGNKPLDNVAVEFLLRYYADHPEAVPVMPSVSAEEVIEVLTKADYPPRRWGPLIGRQAASGHRWKRKKQDLGPAAGRVAFYLVHEVKAGRLKQWERKYVDVIAKNRGVDDVMKSGSFRPKEEATKQRPSRAKRGAKKASAKKKPVAKRRG